MTNVWRNRFNYAGEKSKDRWYILHNVNKDSSSVWEPVPDLPIGSTDWSLGPQNIGGSDQCV